MNESALIVENASRVIVGKGRALELMTVALLAGRDDFLAVAKHHPPGVPGDLAKLGRGQPAKQLEA